MNKVQHSTKHNVKEEHKEWFTKHKSIRALEDKVATTKIVLYIWQPHKHTYIAHGHTRHTSLFTSLSP